MKELSGFHFFWFPLFVWVRRLWREMWWPMGKRDQTLSQFCPCCCDKTPWWKSLKGKQVYVSSQFRQQFVPVVESLWQGLEASGHVHRQERRENECTHACTQLTFSSHIVQDLPLWQWWHAQWLSLPTSVSIFKIIPHSISTGQLDLDSPHWASPLSSF